MFEHVARRWAPICFCCCCCIRYAHLSGLTSPPFSLALRSSVSSQSLAASVPASLLLSAWASHRHHHDLSYNHRIVLTIERMRDVCATDVSRKYHSTQTRITTVVLRWWTAVSARVLKIVAKRKCAARPSRKGNENTQSKAYATLGRGPWIWIYIRNSVAVTVNWVTSACVISKGEKLGKCECCASFLVVVCLSTNE